MKYFFVLGNHPALSVAEIMAVFPEASGYLAADDVFVLKAGRELDAEALIKRLGGTIKIGKIETESPPNAAEALKKLQGIFNILVQARDFAGKFNFGFSFHGPKPLNLKMVGLEMKNYLKAQDVNSRLVVSREANLSSVVVERNKLIKRGMEAVIIREENKFLLGRTLAVQDYRGLSRRDYGRPGRDDKSGMLPPKLAQIMINLSGAKTSDVLLDPFCGSGTILTEAMLLGFQKVIGVDISKPAIDDTKSNIQWIIKNFSGIVSRYELYKKSVLDLSKFMKKDTVGVIVTEPYLGPQRGFFQTAQVIKELDDLYSKALNECDRVLVPGGRIVMVWPVFFNKERLNPRLGKFKIIPLISNQFLRGEENKSLDLTDRGTAIYGRAGQRVFREVVVLEKI